MTTLLNHPLFSLLLCMLGYFLGHFAYRKTKLTLCNPYLIAVCTVMLVLTLFGIPIEHFEEHTYPIQLFLNPITVLLAIPIYRQRDILKTHFLPIMLSTAVGALTSMISVYGLGYLVGLDEILTHSFIPKTATNPIAITSSAMIGGIPSLTIVAVIIAGITGAVTSPLLIKALRLNDPVVEGLAIGTSSHAIGTSKALELGETQGALSGLAIGLTGIFTILLSVVIHSFILL